MLERIMYQYAASAVDSEARVITGSQSQRRVV